MSVAVISRKSATDGGSRFWVPPPRAAASPRPCRRFAAAGSVAASLLAHGGLLLVIMLRDSPVNPPSQIHEIPVEMVTEPPESEKRPGTAGGRENPIRHEAGQNRPGNPDGATQQHSGIAQELKAGNNRFSGLSPGGKLAATAASAKRSPGVSGESPHKYPASENLLALPFDSGPKSFRAVAIPLPAETGGEATSYRFIVGSMLERVKHYPASALQRGVKGIAAIGFVLDDSGGLVSVVLLRSSGQADLDAESVALVSRAAPFPPPPPGAQHSFAIEVAFGMGN